MRWYSLISSARDSWLVCKKGGTRGERPSRVRAAAARPRWRILGVSARCQILRRSSVGRKGNNSKVRFLISGAF